MAQRGRPKKKLTLAQLKECAVFLAGIESAWQRQQAAMVAKGGNRRKAARVADEVVASQQGVGIRRVQQLRAKYAREVRPLVRALAAGQSARALVQVQQQERQARPRAETLGRKLAELRKILTADEFEELLHMRTGAQLMERHLKGAAAERRVTQLTADEIAPGYSAKRKSR